MMFPYSKKHEKLLRVFITFTDITGNNLRFKTNYITQTKVKLFTVMSEKDAVILQNHTRL